MSQADTEYWLDCARINHILDIRNRFLAYDWVSGAIAQE